jgi:RHS repeat-associated protein
MMLMALLIFSVAPRTEAYLFDIGQFILEVGKSVTVKVKGSSGGAAVSLQSVSSSPPGLIQHDLTTSPRNGTGFVNVVITGVAPGSGSVFFSGLNNGGFVSGSLSFLVLGSPGTTAQEPHVGVGGDPINTGNGEYFGDEAVDLNLGGPMPLIFSRYVASKLAEDGLVQAALGPNRSHNFASRIINLSATIKRVVLPTGRALRFDKVGTKWTLISPLDVPFQLLETTTEMLLADPHSKQIWTYDKTTGRLSRIEDGKGNVHTLTYTSGKLSSVSDGLGRTINISQPGTTITSVAGVTVVGLQTETRTVTFNYASGVLTSATDYGGHVTTYGNSGGLPTSVTRPAGNQLFSQIYTGNKVTSQSERGADTSTFTYGTGTTTFTAPTGHTLVDNYDSKGRLISHVDEAGNALTMTYDSAGRRETVTDRLGQKTTLLHHALSGLPHTLINTEGKTTGVAYKPRTLLGIVFQDVSKITWPDGASRSFTYDAKGNVTLLTDEAGKAWKYTYNNRGQVLTITNPLGGVTTNTYDSFGNLASTQPPDTGATTLTYDARHRLTLITWPGGTTVAMTYDMKDRLTSVTDERGKIWQYTYDNNDGLTVVTDPDTETTSMGHDVLDRVTSITDRLGQASNLAFDSRHLLSSFTDRNGNAINLTYDARRRLTSLEDAGGQDWTFDYDNEGRLISVQNPVDPASTWKLNKLGFPVLMSDPLGNTRNLTRDAMQRVVTSFDPMGRQTSYVYDKRGLLISATEQGTGTAKYDRDGLGNITKLTDPNGGAWTMIYQKSGRLIKTTDPLGKSTTAEYDPRGRLSKVNLPDATNTTFAYDPASNLTGAVHSVGPNLAFTYDNLNRLTAANDVALPANNVAFEYDDEGRMTNCEQNGHDFTATYDNAGRLLTAVYFDGLFTVTYAYDSRNRLASVTDSEGTLVTMGYDNAGRLTSQTRTPGIDGFYVYDLAGRMTQIQEGAAIMLNYGLNSASEIIDLDITAPTLPAVTAATQLLKFGKAGEIISAGYTYDLRGRQTAAPVGRTYQWDGASRLVNANGVILTYNGLGDVVTRTDGGNTTRYYNHYALGLAPIVYEDKPAGSDRLYVWTPDGRLLYSVDEATGDPTFYHFDRMGSTLALTDKNGVVTDSYAYGPYGEVLGATGGSDQPFTYIGAFGVRKEGPLYHMRARYYDPATTQFLSRDPESPRLSSPKSTNRYTYAARNPLLYLDPRGTYDEVSRIADQICSSGSMSWGTAGLLGDMFTHTSSKNREEEDRRIALNNQYQMTQMLNQQLAALGPPIPPPPATQEILGGVGDDLGSGRDEFIGTPPLGPVSFPCAMTESQPRLADGPGDDGLNFSSRIRVNFTAEGTTDGGLSFSSDLPFGGPVNINNDAPAVGDSIGDGTPPGGQAGGGAATASSAVLGSYIQIYMALKAAEDALIIKGQQQGNNLTQGEVEAYEQLKKLRKTFGKLIQKLGGTVPK